MKRFGVGVAFAMVIGASLSLVAMGGAYATGVACKSVTGKISTTFKISACTPANAQYVSASAPTKSLTTGTGTLKWLPSNKTTIIATKPAVAKVNGCKAPAIEYDVAGTVTGGTATYTKKGDIVKGRACINTALGTITLVPGTSLTL